MATNTDWFGALKAPFRFADIEVMPQRVVIKDGKARALAIAYFDARAVMNRLDEVFGPEGWTASYEFKTLHSGVDFCMCVLEVNPPGIGTSVIRQDVCQVSDIEAVKGAVSGSLKRAFSALGNRSLYEVDLGWQDCEAVERNGKPVFKAWTPGALNNMARIYAQATDRPAPTVPHPKPPEQMAQEKANIQQWWNQTLSGVDLEVRNEIVRRLEQIESDHHRPSWLVLKQARDEGVTTSEQLLEFLQGGGLL